MCDFRGGMNVFHAANMVVFDDKTHRKVLKDRYDVLGTNLIVEIGQPIMPSKELPEPQKDNTK